MAAGSFLLLAGLARFVGAGFLPASRKLLGDFAHLFPTEYFAWLNPDFPTENVWGHGGGYPPGSWNYGPVIHFVSLPLFLVPWSVVPLIWVTVNTAALAVSFVQVCRLLNVTRTETAAVLALGGLWLMYQPLVNSLAQGNVEILEMALILTAVVQVSRGSSRTGGALIGVAAMIKYLPAGFLFWLFVRRKWRAVAAGVVTIGAIALLTAFTLDWRKSMSFGATSWAFSQPVVGLQVHSITSMLLFRASVLDRSREVPLARWFPPERRQVAATAGLISGFLMAIGYAWLLLRWRADMRYEIGVLFLLMVLPLPWAHDYYYLFAIVPVSVLMFEALRTRKVPLILATVLGYVLISPPVPFSWIDRMDWFRDQFAYVMTFNHLPLWGGLILLFAITIEWLRSAHRLAGKAVAPPIGAYRPETSIELPPVRRAQWVAAARHVDRFRRLTRKFISAAVLLVFGPVLAGATVCWLWLPQKAAIYANLAENAAVPVELVPLKDFAASEQHGVLADVPRSEVRVVGRALDELIVFVVNDGNAVLPVTLDSLVAWGIIGVTDSEGIYSSAVEGFPLRFREVASGVHKAYVPPQAFEWLRRTYVARRARDEQVTAVMTLVGQIPGQENRRLYAVRIDFNY